MDKTLNFIRIKKRRGYVSLLLSSTDLEKAVMYIYIYTERGK